VTRVFCAAADAHGNNFESFMPTARSAAIFGVAMTRHTTSFRLFHLNFEKNGRTIFWIFSPKRENEKLKLTGAFFE
jgi:hypothetical protein